MPAIFKGILRTMFNFWTYLVVYATLYTILCANKIVTSNEISHLVKRSDDSVPRILSTPSRLSVLEGSTVVFPCRTDKSDKFALMWKRGKNKLLFAGSVPADSDKKFKITDQTSLQIDSVTASHTDEYTCYFNSNPPVELTHILLVLVPPKITLDPPDGHIIVKKGDSIVVKCNADGYPKPIITWKALKGTLPGGVKEIQGNTLAIASADIFHSGIYICKADNEVGEPDKASVRIKVLYAPEVSVNTVWVHAREGSNVKLQCVATAEPLPTMYWTRMPNTVLTEDKDITLQLMSRSHYEGVLTIKISQLTSEKFGSYSCYANNSLGSAFRIVEISGLAEPVKFRSNVSGNEEESFLLSWTVKSYTPIIEYLLRIRSQKSRVSNSSPPPWTDVMIPVGSDQSFLHSHTYNITGLETETAYEVVMQARNHFGWNHPSETFTFYTLGGEPQADAKEDIILKESDNNILPGASFQEKNSGKGTSDINHSNKLPYYSVKFLLAAIISIHLPLIIKSF